MQHQKNIFFFFFYDGVRGEELKSLAAWGNKLLCSLMVQVVVF